MKMNLKKNMNLKILLIISYGLSKNQNLLFIYYLKSQKNLKFV